MGKRITVCDNGDIIFDGVLTDDEKLALAVLFGWVEDSATKQVILYTGIPTSSDKELPEKEDKNNKYHCATCGNDYCCEPNEKAGIVVDPRHYNYDPAKDD
jgi:hypothetical protein